MNKCKYENVKKYRICIGNLNKSITLQKRVIDNWSTIDNGEPSYTFTTIATVYSSVKTKSPYIIVDGIGQNAKYTHKFIIRYRDDIGNEAFILFQNKRYNIVNFINEGEENKFLSLYAIISGYQSLKGSE